MLKRYFLGGDVKCKIQFKGTVVLKMVFCLLFFQICPCAATSSGQESRKEALSRGRGRYWAFHLFALQFLDQQYPACTRQNGWVFVFILLGYYLKVSIVKESQFDVRGDCKQIDFKASGNRVELLFQFQADQNIVTWAFCQTRSHRLLLFF